MREVYIALKLKQAKSGGEPESVCSRARNPPASGGSGCFFIIHSKRIGTIRGIGFFAASHG